MRLKYFEEQYPDIAVYVETQFSGCYFLTEFGANYDELAVNSWDLYRTYQRLFSTLKKLQLSEQSIDESIEARFRVLNIMEEFIPDAVCNRRWAEFIKRMDVEDWHSLHREKLSLMTGQEYKSYVSKKEIKDDDIYWIYYPQLYGEAEIQEKVIPCLNKSIEIAEKEKEENTKRFYEALAQTEEENPEMEARIDELIDYIKSGKNE